MAAAGRDPDRVYVLQGISPIIGGTDAEARAERERLEALIPEATGLSFLSDYFPGVDFEA